MEKKNTVKFPEKIKKDNPPVKIFDTVQEASVEAVRQAAESNVSPSSVMVTAKDGYATGDGAVYAAKGITASPRVPKPAIPGSGSESPTEAPTRTTGDLGAE